MEKIESSGISGTKKADLKKTYGKECESILEELKAKEQIFIEKKGVAYFIWTKENYIQHLDRLVGLSASFGTKLSVERDRATLALA